MGKRIKYKVHTNEEEYLEWFNKFWNAETKRITENSKERKRGRKPKGSQSLKVEFKTIILNFD